MEERSSEGLYKVIKNIMSHKNSKTSNRQKGQNTTNTKRRKQSRYGLENNQGYRLHFPMCLMEFSSLHKVQILTSTRVNER